MLYGNSYYFPNSYHSHFHYSGAKNKIKIKNTFPFVFHEIVINAFIALTISSKTPFHFKSKKKNPFHFRIL